MRVQVLDLSVWHWWELRLCEFVGSCVFGALSGRKCNCVLLLAYYEKLQ